jgi:hypothetical protein
MLGKKPKTAAKAAAVNLCKRLIILVFDPCSKNFGAGCNEKGEPCGSPLNS